MKGSTNASARPNIRIQDASAEFVANTDTSTNAEFPYRASVSITGVTHYMSATVIYSQAQCTSGKYASYCQTYDGGVYIYAKTDVGTQTIPAISCDISVNYINVENVPTSGSSAVITSGGVYTNCVRTSGSQSVNDYKTFTSTIKSETTSDWQNISIKRSDADKSTTVSGWTRTGQIEVWDKDGEECGSLQFAIVNNEGNELQSNLIATGIDGTQRVLSVRAQNGKGYATAPYRAYNASNTSDIVTIGMHLQAMGWIKQTNSNLGGLATCNEVMFRGTFTPTGDSRIYETCTIHPGNASGGINLAISYLTSYYAVYYIHPQSIYTVATSGNWNTLEVWYR